MSKETADGFFDYLIEKVNQPEFVHLIPTAALIFAVYFAGILINNWFEK